ncbi:MAG: tRNA (adenosine(37)-N6)-dimethylallyltransferase MiaA [Pseudomonadales bacterium]
MNGSLPLVLALAGPTAVGKTDVALALADRYPVALISMDSAMVYRGMDIGTAKPPRELLAQYPHALVDVRDPAEPYSAADFVADADAAVRAALGAGRLPLLVGGTMLYLRSFREGLAQLPPADAGMRAAILAEAERDGWAGLYAELLRVDPVAARGLHPNNHTRIQRAVEVYRLTGSPISQWWQEHAGSSACQRLGARLQEVAILPESRGELKRRIEVRFRAMLEAGLVAEVAALRARGDLSLELPSMRAVGYRQVWEYLQGQGDQEELALRGIAATRQLAKRQLTWLRSWPHMARLHWGEAQLLAERIGRLCHLEIS